MDSVFESPFDDDLYLPQSQHSKRLRIFEDLAPSSMVLETSSSSINFENGAQNAPNNIYVSGKFKENERGAKLNNLAKMKLTNNRVNSYNSVHHPAACMDFMFKIMKSTIVNETSRYNME